MKTCELTGKALDWAVAESAGLFTEGFYESFQVIDGKLHLLRGGCVINDPYRPSYNWAQGGQIIEREGISWHCGNKSNWHAYGYGSHENFTGPTPLIAAMRCYVVSKLGEEINIPENLK